MFLKRTLLTALGALGLGAFAAGTASAQQIPAPDIFDDQILCSTRVPSAMDTPMPSVIPMGATMSPLDTLIGDGMTAIDTTGTGMGSYQDLGYVIQATVANCGATAAGDVYTADTTAFTADANGAIPLDVAAGYTDLLTKFVAVYGDPGDTTSTGAKGVLDAANTALSMAIAMGTEGAALTLLQDAVTRADEAYQKALATFNAAAGGPIYQAGADEWMAKAAVTKSVADYNTQVGKTNTAQTDLDNMDYNNAAGNSLWVPLGNTELFAGGTPVVTIAMGMGTVNLGQLVQYTNADLANPQVGMAAVAGMGTGDGSTGNEAPVASDVTASNFDAAGNLIVPMEANTDTADDLTDLRNTVSTTNGVDDIRTLVENANIAAAALKKARDDNIGLNQAIYDEAYRRAQAEADYYNARWAEVVAHNVDTRTAIQKLRYLDDGAQSGNGINEPDETTPNPAFVEQPISIASRNTALAEEQNKRFLAEQDLRTRVALREAATADVRAKFTDPQDFYNQLVARRTALKATADKAVADATTPSMALNDAAEAAAKALGEANTKKMTVDALFDDPNDPTEALVAELLKGDDDGDDGQALVNAISSNYDDINALTAEDDPSTLEDETGRIVKLEEQVGMLTGDGSGTGLSALEDKVNALTAMDDPETMDDETGPVTENANDIMDLEEQVDINVGDIGQIKTDLYGETSGQHGDLAACDATGLLNVATCANARSLHNEEDIEDVNDKLTDKKDYIDNLGTAIGVDPVTGEATDESGMSKIDMNAKAIADETKARMDADDEVRGEFAAEDTAIRKEFADADNEVRGEFAAEDTAIRKEFADADNEVRGEFAAEDTAIRKEFADADNEVRGEFAAEDTAIRGEFAMADNEVRGEFAAEDMAIRGEFAMADNEVRGEFAAEDMAIRGEFAMADNEVRGEFAAEDMAIRGEFAAEDTAIRGEFAMADNEVRGEFAAEDMAIRGEFAAADSMLRSDLTGMINSNTGMINDNRRMIGELSDDLDVVRAGVAASMALAGMPAINGRGIAIGVGSYDGESAFAVGFQIQGEQASFKIGVTSSGGETGASAGVGFNF